MEKLHSTSTIKKMSVFRLVSINSSKQSRPTGSSGSRGVILRGEYYAQGNTSAKYSARESTSQFSCFRTGSIWENIFHNTIIDEGPTNWSLYRDDTCFRIARICVAMNIKSNAAHRPMKSNILDILWRHHRVDIRGVPPRYSRESSWTVRCHSQQLLDAKPPANFASVHLTPVSESGWPVVSFVERQRWQFLVGPQRSFNLLRAQSCTTRTRHHCENMITASPSLLFPWDFIDFVLLWLRSYGACMRFP